MKNTLIRTENELREALSCGWVFTEPNHVALPFPSTPKLQISDELLSTAIGTKMLVQRGSKLVSNVRVTRNPDSEFDANRWIYRGGNNVRVDHTVYVYPNDIPALEAYAKALNMEHDAAIAVRKLTNGSPT